MTPVTYTNLNKLLLIRDIQEIAKTYINDDRSYRWIWKNKIADVYHNMAYADFYGRLFTEHHECAMYAYLYISDPDGYEGIAFQRWLADIKAKDDEVPWQRFI
jgi:hypothetical protein